MEFFLGGAAGVCAGIFTNPFDVIKTRQQVQGELETHNGTKTKRARQPYRNSWQAMRSIVAAEGVRGMQKGLVPALGFQMVMNGTRMGMFQMVNDYGLTRDPVSGELSPLRCILWSGTAGLVGAGIACPLNMVKTRLQIQSASQTIAVGYQHGHEGTRDALMTAYRAGGMRGVWRGFTGIVPRTCVASAIQLTTFQQSKEVLAELEVSRMRRENVVRGATILILMFPRVLSRVADLSWHAHAGGDCGERAERLGGGLWHDALRCGLDAYVQSGPGPERSRFVVSQHFRLFRKDGTA